jgi:hypothetical protein
MRYRIIIVGFLFSLFLLGGCTGLGETLEQTTLWRNNADELRAETESSLAELVVHRDNLPPDTPQSRVADASIARARAKIAALDAAITHADLAIEEAHNPSDGLTQTTQYLLPFLPAPVQAPALLGAALLATLVRSKQLKDGAQSIIQSIQHTLDRDDSFKAAFISNADSIRTIQTPLARRMVDRAQRT